MRGPQFVPYYAERHEIPTFHAGTLGWARSQEKIAQGFFAVGQFAVKKNEPN